MQRHLFLYNKMLLFCKRREETADSHDKTPSYGFKHSLKMSAVGITENVKGDIKKFEVWYNGREEVYIIQAPSMDVKNMWVSEIRKVLTGQLEACREASQLHQKISENIYHAPMRNMRKMALRQSDSSSPETGFRKSNPSPNMRQKRGPLTAGPLTASVKTKRHEIKSDPTPFGYEDTLRGALPVAGKGKGSTVAAPTVPRSTSQPVNQKGWTQRRLPSMDTEDFETIPSSAEELSNSSDGEEDNKNGDSNRFRVQLTYESRTTQDLSLESGDLVQFLEEAENGH
ncbi:guanine nucleotide exchange factor DBS-like isoform X3 [Hypomesus transpacificus]|nr:guanine nucleotide exchange factor DBS-like isoform X3 [Hypomesus transpacificus]